ncbi:MAG TPA: DUF2157 domain-containing protein [Terriglobales bacterium]|nr:DUF2157 domain-containing protein [Terriglobales bacterium]
MRKDLEPVLERWISVKLIDLDTAQKIRAYENERRSGSGQRWRVLILLALGALMLAGGVLLFVAAHWDSLSPAQRFSLVLALMAVLHVGGALASKRFPALGTALHSVGTIALGGGVFLAGQIFNLQEHWPGGVLLWALGAWVGWWALRDWVQGSLVALLTPAWIISEWIDATEHCANAIRVVPAFILLLAITYLTAITSDDPRSHMRRALMWIGGLALIPAALMTVVLSIEIVGRTQFYAYYRNDRWLGFGSMILPWAFALILPVALAWFLRRRAAWMNGVAAVWVLVLAYSHFIGANSWWNKLSAYPLAALGAAGLVAWGMQEDRKACINLGLAGFALTVMFFYFSEVMGKLGRSAALIGLGLVFLLMAWALEKTRRKLMARMAGGAR